VENSICKNKKKTNKKWSGLAGLDKPPGPARIIDD